jgi:peptidyl-prolyl cis-trans isomerase SurA
MRTLLTALRLLALPLTLPSAPAPVPVAPAAEAAEDGGVLVDRLVAVVDDDPILWSDVDRTIGLGLVEPREGESRGQLERRVLDGLIDQRLRLHEIARHNFAPVPPDEVDRQLEHLRASFGGPEELAQRLAALGLDEAGLRQLVRRQLRVLVYVEQRLGPRVFVRLDEIRSYYDDVLTAEMAAQGLEPPPLEEVRDQIHDLLHEQRLNREIETWTEELRLAADVADYLDRTETELPPVVERIEE